MADQSDQAVTFSADTVLFDTVFTTIGSVTLPLKVYNPHNAMIVVEDIDLVGGTDSPYRMAVDGENGVSFNDVEIGPNDSLWVFVEVTIDPNNADFPLIVEDSIRFITNGNTAYVNLVAWGQDAYFHGSLDALTVLPCDEVWNADKPHVLYGIVAVDEGCNLTINAGTQVYCHSGSGLYVYRGGLNIEGALGNEVVFCGDRLEPEYENLSGQWGIQLDVEFETGFGVESATINRGGIWLFETDEASIDYAIIKNGIIGVQADTTGTLTGNSLQMTNTIISNMSAIGFLAQGAHVKGENDLIVNCGETCVALDIGGKYDFNHCTFANWWTAASRQAPAFYMSNYYVDVNENVQARPLSETIIRNSILYGNNASLSDYNEVILDMYTEDGFDPQYLIENCYVDTEADLTDGTHFLNTNQGAGDPPFLDPFNGDFDFAGQVPSAFATNGSGLISPDLKGQPRTNPPAKGCYMDE